MKRLRVFARRARPNPSTAERDEALRNEGRAAEVRRIEGVYRAASLVTLEPLIERAMFQTGMSPIDAAVMQLVALQAAHAAAAAAKPCPPATGEARPASDTLH